MASIVLPKRLTLRKQETQTLQALTASKYMLGKRLRSCSFVVPKVLTLLIVCCRASTHWVAVELPRDTIAADEWTERSGRRAVTYKIRTG